MPCFSWLIWSWPELHRLVAALDEIVAIRRSRSPLFERGLELLLEIVLAALDLVDDRLLVAAGDRRLQVLEALVRLAEERAGLLGIAAQPANFGAQLLDDLLTLVGALAEDFAEALVVDVLGGVLIARDAVDGRRDQRVECG